MAFRKPKKVKTNKVSTITIAYLTTQPGDWGRDNLERLRVLFDSGCESTLVNSQVVRKLPKTAASPTSWKTKAGTFTTNKKCLITLKIPAFFEHKEVEWTAYV